MWGRSTPIVEASLRRLHPECIENAGEIRRLLQEARDQQVSFHRGLNARVDLEVATLEEIGPDHLVLVTSNFDAHSLDGQIFLNFSVEGRPYFFSALRQGSFSEGRLILSRPRMVFYGERRDRGRESFDRQPQSAWRVELEDGRGETRLGRLQDSSPSGLGVMIEGQPLGASSQRLKLRYLEGPQQGEEQYLNLRHQREAEGQTGWTRIGLMKARGPVAEVIEIEQRERILEGPEPMVLPSEPVLSPDPVRQLRIRDDRGEEIAALVDRWGDAGAVTAIVLPNGWGQTKEALLPLAQTLVSTFRRAQERVMVVRYDGIRRKGQSHNDAESGLPGRTDENFVFSQGVRDLNTVVGHLRSDPDGSVSNVIVVSFSAAAIEVRKALAEAPEGFVDGWVSVVGSPDLQSMTRAISGGVDFVGGIEQGLSFGKQELLGVRVDIDRIGADATEHRMSFIEDSRRDMEAISVPISWFHGRYDAWVDLNRVQDILSHGQTGNRRLVVLPTGHQLSTSLQARHAFASIACEVARIARGVEVQPVCPDPSELRRIRSEEARLAPRPAQDLHAFWRDYLVGRDGSLGIELLTSSQAYRALMKVQLEALGLESDQRVVDLGSGTGSFVLALAGLANRPEGLRVINVDYVREALVRGRDRFARASGSETLHVDHAEVDLDLGPGSQGIPLASGSQDRILSSLLLSYLESPEEILSEIHRVLKPGGRLVISSLCRDADISRLYSDAYAELQSGSATQELPELRPDDLSRLARSFLNDAARIIEFEGQGAFQFWDPDELSSVLERAGFEVLTVQRSLGTPPQAVVLSATRP
ncbi:MAG: hypothetical protein CMN75_05260 [Spirochaeta sp.]|nr:hypothetical protein [Spirochaeta sp.]RPG03417.1 MAG: methyltransferase domain-containing protein [Proteobacteria bacterium TMED72]